MYFCLQVPAFQGTDGTLLFKSNAIAYYLATDELRGKTVSDRAQVQQWLDFSDNDILPAYCSWLFPILGIMQYNKQVYSTSLTLNKIIWIIHIIDRR